MLFLPAGNSSKGVGKNFVVIPTGKTPLRKLEAEKAPKSGKGTLLLGKNGDEVRGRWTQNTIG